ncbi:sugar kinase [Yoonia sp.]|nr:sugar kinase [Yoonia sp.]
MLTFKNTNVVTVGEAMIEMATVGEGLYRRAFAGDTFNTAWHMAQVLENKANIGFVTRVGQDDLSHSFLTEAAADGLDVSGISRDPVRTMGLYLISLKGVERSFAYWRDTSAARLLADDETALANAFQGAGLIHLSGITLAILSPSARVSLIKALAQARRNGAVVSFDPNIRPRLWSSHEEITQTVQRVLDVTDIALPSFDDEATFWKDATPHATVTRFVDAGVREVVVKNGDQPLSWYSGGQRAEVATPVVQGICDTTGAGDAFNAGYLAARLLGQAPSNAVLQGQRMSGEVICHFGARIPKSEMHRVFTI